MGCLKVGVHHVTRVTVRFESIHMLENDNTKD